MFSNIDKKEVAKALNKILESELAGVVCYTHYSLMVYGYNRIPIVSWLRNQAQSSLAHANEAGELITSLGEHPSLKIANLLETHKHDIRDILLESLDIERKSIDLYKDLLNLVKDKSVLLEEYARKMIAEEEAHCAEVDKMLRKPGDVESFSN
ncbi:MAG: bacterioferritin [Candidatus Sericytochromatia bacterium]|nr:MAG: bacterioferritin [Candidatus Sericytochromatia bacterium]